MVMIVEKNDRAKIRSYYQEVTGIPIMMSLQIVLDKIGPPELQEYHRELLKDVGCLLSTSPAVGEKNE